MYNNNNYNMLTTFSLPSFTQCIIIINIITLCVEMGEYFSTQTLALSTPTRYVKHAIVFALDLAAVMSTTSLTLAP